jgi:hypothetical protein
MIVQTVKLGRLRWLGHLTRANEKSPRRKLTLSKPKGKRKPEKSSLRWLESVMKDKVLTGNYRRMHKQAHRRSFDETCAS